MEWNKAQKDAIQLRDRNILVSAGAGSGKTTVLTERILTLIKEGFNITDFLICTFTEDAAASMKAKIRKVLIEAKMFAQSELVNVANISTFHAFCKRVICDNFDVVDLPPKFNILSNDTVVKAKAMEETLNTLYVDDEFTQFAMRISPNNDEIISEIIEKAFDFLSNIPDGLNWFNSQINGYEQNNYDNVKDEYFNNVLLTWKNYLSFYESLLGKTVIDDEESFSNPYGLTDKSFGFILDEYYTLDQSRKYLEEKKYDLVCDTVFKTLRYDKADDPGLKELFKAKRDGLKKSVRDKAKAFLTFFEEEDLLNTLIFDLKQLHKAVVTFDNIFSRMKLENNDLSFNDLEKYTYKILCDTPTANIYKEQFKHIFVDEYQDTSKIQQAIINKIKSENNLFMVGDIKQSIYGFRNADPSMFHNLYEEFKEDGINTKIDLNKNYRSTENILNCVNDIFSVLLNLHTKYYTPKSHLSTDKKPGGAPVDIFLFPKEDEDETLIEEKCILDQIRKALKDGYEYKDIVILLRKIHNSKATSIKQYLHENGVPVYLGQDDDSGMYVDIEVFLDLLMLIDNPINDIPMVSVLYSDFVKLTTDELIELKSVSKNSSYYDRIKLALKDPASVSKELYEKLFAFDNMLVNFRLLSKNLSVSELILKVLEKTDYLKYLESSQDGKSKVAQIYTIASFAKTYEEQGYYGLSSFLDYYTKLKKKDKNFEIVSTVSGNNIVRIMTIHKSKGLEFPVVILADTNSSPCRDNTSKLHTNKNIGIGLNYTESEFYISSHNPVTMIIEQQNHIEDIEEAMRVLYVALTRAMDKLIITGTLDEKATSEYVEGNMSVPDITKITTKVPLIKLILGAYKENTNRKGVFNVHINPEINIEEEEDAIEETASEIVTVEKVEEILNKEHDFSILEIPQKTSVTKVAKEDNAIILPSKQDALIQKVASLKDNEETNEELIKNALKNLYITEEEAESLSCVDLISFVPPAKADNEGAKKGTLIHGLLSILKPNETSKELLDRAIKDRFISKEDSELVDLKLIDKFIQSDIYKEILESDKVYREKPFIFYLEPEYGYTDAKVMIQGIIDCMYTYEDGYIILDYKTDNIYKNAEKILKERYTGQLHLYKLAIEKLTNKPVKKCLIYHLRTGKTIEL